MSGCTRREIETLLVEHLEALNRTAFFLTRGKRIELDDAVQLACKRILERGSQLQDPAKFKAWSRQIMISQIKEAEKHEMPPDLISGDDSELAEDSAAWSKLASILDRHDIMAIWPKLSDIHREVFILYGLEGFSYAEIGEILGIPEGTVMSRMNRARDAAKQLLGAT